MFFKVRDVWIYGFLSLLFIGCGNDFLTRIEDESSQEVRSFSSEYVSSAEGTKIGDNILVEPENCSVQEENKILYEKMQSLYLWYQELPSVDYQDYNDSKKLLEDLKYKVYDRWSYIVDNTKYNNYYEEGVYVGFGFSLGLEDNRLFVKYVYQDSPAYRAGLRRDTEILEINGLSIEKIEEEKRWETILGEVAVGSSSHFKISKENQESWVTLSMEKVTIDSLFYSHVMNVEGKKVGYFVLNSFIEPTKLALKRVFETFKEEGIEELIVDMRYNGGGRIAVANYLASLITGAEEDKGLWSSLRYNDKQLKKNTDLYLKKEPNSLMLERLFVLSSSKTCSSSELIINGLTPYMEVNVIGTSSCGKPVGMQGSNFCGKHFAPIEFKILNTDGYGEYFHGIAPRCKVEDDLSHALGDPHEAILKEALFVMQHNHCSVHNQEEGWDKTTHASAHLLREGFEGVIDLF